MLNYTLNVAAAPVGAVFTGACSPWASLSVVPAHAVVGTPIPVQAVGAPVARSAAFRPVPAMTLRLAGVTAEMTSAFDNRKQTVHKTRINAGGYGAMGPHPEREPA